MNTYAPTLYDGVSRLCDLFGEPFSRGERYPSSGGIVGRLVLHGYFDLSFSRPLHGQPEPKLRDHNFSTAKETLARYLSKSVHSVVDRSLACSRTDKRGEVESRVEDKTAGLSERLRILAGTEHSRRSIEWMVQRIAERYMFDSSTEEWDLSVIGTVGERIISQVHRDRPQRPIDEFYAFLDVVVDLSH